MVMKGNRVQGIVWDDREGAGGCVSNYHLLDLSTFPKPQTVFRPFGGVVAECFSDVLYFGPPRGWITWNGMV